MSPEQQGKDIMLSKAQYLNIYADKQMILRLLIRQKIITSPLETELFPSSEENGHFIEKDTCIPLFIAVPFTLART